MRGCTGPNNILLFVRDSYVNSKSDPSHCHKLSLQQVACQLLLTPDLFLSLFLFFDVCFVLETLGSFWEYVLRKSVVPWLTLDVYWPIVEKTVELRAQTQRQSNLQHAAITSTDDFFQLWSPFEEYGWTWSGLKTLLFSCLRLTKRCL